ncbi:MAG: aldo/keto reductase [Firmicutes bacterium]|nr:aldo/keto reductase [Bacillota bacterium]
MEQYEPKPPVPARDGVDPGAVPFVTLSGGARMPAVGLGTFGSDRYGAREIAQTVKGAIGAGYRHIDCAKVYGNEREIGAALAEVFASGEVRREELFITSKLWNDQHGPRDALVNCAETLRDLGLDYLDLYLVHWPFPNYHPPFCDGDTRNPDSRPFFIEEFMSVWRQMEKLVDMGLARAIGTSSMTIPKMEELWPLARVKPACNEMELHPHFQQPELRAYLWSKGVVPIGFSPIGSPSRPERDRTAEDTCELTDPKIMEIAEVHGAHPALICLKWGVQSGHAVIPFSVKRQQYIANLRCAAEDPLTAAEMAVMDSLDKNCRLIKGQVFLWPGAESWENLWDINGVIDRSGWLGAK